MKTNENKKKQSHAVCPCGHAGEVIFSVYMRVCQWTRFCVDWCRQTQSVSKSLQKAITVTYTMTESLFCWAVVMGGRESASSANLSTYPSHTDTTSASVVKVGSNALDADT